MDEWISDFKRRRKLAHCRLNKLQSEAGWKPLPVVNSPEFQLQLQSARDEVTALESDAIVMLLQQTASDISHMIAPPPCCTWTFRSQEDHYDYHFKERECLRVTNEEKEIIYEQMMQGMSIKEAEYYVANKIKRLKQSMQHLRSPLHSPLHSSLHSSVPEPIQYEVLEGDNLFCTLCNNELPIEQEYFINVHFMFMNDSMRMFCCASCALGLSKKTTSIPDGIADTIQDGIADTCIRKPRRRR